MSNELEFNVPYGTRLHLEKGTDITGYKFTRLLVLGIGFNRKGDIYWKCICDCGSIKYTTKGTLINGRTKSCGCLNIEHGKTQNYKHGGSPASGQSKEYCIWAGIKKRCTNKNSQSYWRYGGSGITMHKPWIDSFKEFIDYVGYIPSAQHSIDRYPNKNGNYEPGNVRWATMKEQNRNKNNNRYLKYGNKELILSDWAMELNMTISLLFIRLKTYDIGDLVENGELRISKRVRKPVK